MYLYGYRVGEVNLPEILEMKTLCSLKFNKAYRSIPPWIRRPVQVSLGCILLGFANPHVCIADAATAALGAFKRLFHKHPTPDKSTMLRFKKFVRKWLRKNLKPLSDSDVLDFEAWLASTNYTQTRKNQLRIKYSKMLSKYDRKNFLVKSFIKDETYPTYKHARTINSRDDIAKCLMGPWFKSIEKVVFNTDVLPWFIKKVPRHLWPEYIVTMLGRNASRYIATDYTAFEGQFTREMMHCCEFQLYKYMTARCSGHEEFWWMLDNVLAGVNVCQFKEFTVKMIATRMSGEMCTSLGNGFSNLMFMLFTCREAGCTDVKGVFEGDDGLCTMKGKLPGPEHFAKLGLTIKLVEHSQLETASFCGMIFDSVEMRNITDPIDTLMEFGYCSGKYAKSNLKTKLALIKAKSLSLLYQYPGCPIIAALARYGMRVTRGIRVGQAMKGMNLWEREVLIDALKYKAIEDLPIGWNTRMIMQNVFGVRVEHQIEIEHYLDGLKELTPLNIPLVGLYVNDAARHYYASYSDQTLGAGGVEAPVLSLLATETIPEGLALDGDVRLKWQRHPAYRSPFTRG